MKRADANSIMPQIAESNPHFASMVRQLANNRRASSVVKANVLQWQAERAARSV